MPRKQQKRTAAQELSETIGIYATLRDAARGLMEGSPALLAGLEAEIKKLQARHKEISERALNAAADYTKYTRLHQEAGRELHRMLHPEHLPKNGKREDRGEESPIAAAARLRRQIAKIERDIARKKNGS